MSLHSFKFSPHGQGLVLIQPLPDSTPGPKISGNCSIATISKVKFGNNAPIFSFFWSPQVDRDGANTQPMQWAQPHYNPATDKRSTLCVYAAMESMTSQMASSTHPSSNTCTGIRVCTGKIGPHVHVYSWYFAMVGPCENILPYHGLDCLTNNSLLPRPWHFHGFAVLYPNQKKACDF